MGGHAHPESTLDHLNRGSLDVSGLFCVPCKRRGHDCYAHVEVDGDPLCIFCEDGVPCAHDQKSDRVLIPKASKPRRRPKPSEESPKMATQTQRVNGHSPAPPARVCKCGCGEIVPAGNRFSYIVGHMRKRKVKAKAKKRGPYKKRAPKVDPRIEALDQFAAAIEPPPGQDAPDVQLVLSPPAPRRLAVMVSESQLDQYLTKLEFEWHLLIPKLPVDVKLALVNAVLLAESEPA